jgi:hypothetical protein
MDPVFIGGIWVSELRERLVNLRRQVGVIEVRL